jgi:hypothetical protein
LAFAFGTTPSAVCQAQITAFACVGLVLAAQLERNESFCDLNAVATNNPALNAAFSAQCPSELSCLGQFVGQELNVTNACQNLTSMLAVLPLIAQIAQSAANSSSSSSSSTGGAGGVVLVSSSSTSSSGQNSLQASAARAGALVGVEAFGLVLVTTAVSMVAMLGKNWGIMKGGENHSGCGRA